MGLSPGHKRTEIGVIPQDWRVETIGNLGTVVRGASPRPAGDPRYFNGSYIPWLTVAALTNVPDHQMEITETVGFLTEEGSQHSRVLDKETLIIANSGATLGVAKLLAVKSCANDGVAAIIHQQAGDKRFLAYFINTQTKRLREVIATGNGQPNLNTGLIKEMLVPLPEQSEQRVIATALTDVDALLDGLERLIVKKRDLKQAAVQQLLTGHTRLPGFRGQWERVSMRSVLSQNATYGIVTTGRFVQQGVKMVRSGDIVSGDINTDLPMVSLEKSVEYRRTSLLEGDVLIALVGYPGSTARVTSQLVGANISRAVGLLRPGHKLSSDYLVCFLNSADGKRMVLAPSAGSAQQVVNLSSLNRLEFTLPSVSEQQAIAAVLSDMHTELTTLEQRFAKTRDLKQAMIQELLTGKTRLVPAGVADA